jgi:hypothetical protein
MPAQLVRRHSYRFDAISTGSTPSLLVLGFSLSGYILSTDQRLIYD